MSIQGIDLQPEMQPTTSTPMQRELGDIVESKKENSERTPKDAVEMTPASMPHAHTMGNSVQIDIGRVWSPSYGPMPTPLISSPELDADIQ